MEKLTIVTTTTETKDDAEKLAQLLLKKNLIACAQVSGPITSHYRWDGETVMGQEFSLSVKTVKRTKDQVKKTIQEHHPYDVPEILVTFMDEVSSQYFDWVKGEIS